MSQILPQDIVNIREAYNSVYLSEESEQIDEIAPLIGLGAGYLAARAGQGFVQGLRGDQNPAAKPTQSKYAGYRDAAFNKAKAIKGSPVVGPARPAATTSARPVTTTRPSAAPATRSSATAKPAPTAAAKPAPTAAAKPAPSSGDNMKTWAKANPSLAAKVKPGQSGYASIQQARAETGGSSAAPAAAKMNTSNITRTAFSSKTPSLSPSLSTSSSSSTPAVAKPTPKPTPAATGSKKPGSIVSGFDMFDVVKGHLIDEGYADTEEAAIMIMVNMSEEWKLNIINNLISQ